MLMKVIVSSKKSKGSSDILFTISVKIILFPVRARILYRAQQSMLGWIFYNTMSSELLKQGLIAVFRKRYPRKDDVSELNSKYGIFPTLLFTENSK